MEQTQNQHTASNASLTDVEPTVPASPIRQRKSGTRARIVAALAVGVLASGVAIIPSASPAAAATVPYATAGNITCINGTAGMAGALVGTVPNYVYPAQAAQAARWPGELDYYKMDLQLWTNSGWATVAYASRWIPIYGLYSWQGAGGQYQWDINTSGYYRVIYTIYWSPTGQQASAATGYCHVEKPVGGGMWGMW